MTAIEFNNQVALNRDSLKYFALSLTANPESAGDLVQDTILKAFVNRSKFRPGTNLKAWLNTIMKNTFINNYRKNGRVSQILDDDEDFSRSALLKGAHHDHPEHALNMKEITKVMNSVSDDLRIPFEMYFEGYKYKEIADELNIPIGSVKSRIFLARKKMMKRLQDHR